MGKGKEKAKPKPVPKKVSAYEIERAKNIAENKVLLARAEEVVLKKMGISGPLPPLFPDKELKEKRSRSKRPPVPAEQLRRGRSGDREKR
jgi:hypothetical protein